MKLLDHSRPITVADKCYYDDHMLLRGSAAWVWNELPLVPYGFRGHEDRKNLGWTNSLSLAKLRSGEFHFQIAHTDSGEDDGLGSWEQQRERHIRQHGNPSPEWFEANRLAAERMRSLQSFGKHVYFGFELGTRGPISQLRDTYPPDWEPVGPKERERWRRVSLATRRTLARGALRANPLPAWRLQQIRRNALFRGLEMPEASRSRRKWFGQRDTVDEFEGCELTVVIIPTPKGARTAVRVTAPDGRVTYTAGFVMKDFPSDGLLFPHMKPWMAHVDGLGRPFQLDVRGRMIVPRKAAGMIGRRMDLAVEQDRDASFANHDLPIETAAQIQLAREWKYIIPRRRLPMVDFWATLRADSDTAEGLLDRFDEASEHYLDMGIGLEWPNAMSQVDLLVQSIPGMPRKFHSYRQFFPVEVLGCGLPTAASGLRHRTGMYVGPATGRTGAQRDIVTFDPHYAITRSEEQGAEHVESAGGTVVLGKPRAGKSGMVTQIAAEYALAGVPTLLLDMGGMTRKLAHVPKLRGKVHVSDLVEAGGGSADPMTEAVIPGDWQDPNVQFERAHLTRDTLGLLAWRALAQNEDAATALREAISAVAASSESCTAAVLERLRKGATKAAKNLGSALTFDLQVPHAQVLTGEGGRGVSTARAPLTIITGGGLVLADHDKHVSEWDARELFGGAVLGVAAHRSNKLLWDLPQWMLKVFECDEAHAAVATPGGRRAISDQLRHGPKRGVATVLATHNAQDLARLGFVAAGTSTWAIFRTTDDKDLAAQLALAGVEDTRDTRRRIKGLRNGECLLIFPGGEMDTVRWDQYDVELAEAQNTTAGRRPADLEVVA